MDELKERLRALRHARGMTQDQLAERAGLDRVEVSALEVGRNQAGTVRVLKALAKAYGFGLQQMSDFIDGTLPLAELASQSVDEAPRRPQPGENRLLAAQLARDDGVQDEAVAAVLAEPIQPRDAHRSVLWWARRMALREQELVSSGRPMLVESDELEVPTWRRQDPRPAADRSGPVQLRPKRHDKT